MHKLIAASFITIAAMAASAARADELIVGLDMPLTGSFARVGAATHEGVQVAADIFNRKNGRHTIKLLTIDDESQPAKAVAAIEKLSADGAMAFTGGYGSNIIGPASDAAEKLNKVYMTSGGVATELTKRGLKNFFRITDSAGYSRALQGLFNELGIKSASVIYSTKEATAEVARILQKAWIDEGKAVTMHPFDPAITDFKPILHKIKVQDRSEAIAMIGYENDYVAILRAAKVLKPDIKAIAGVWSLATAKMGADFPDLTNNVYGSASLPHPAEFKTPEEKEFAETHKRMFNKEPDYLNVFGSVQAMLLFNAMAKAAEAGTLRTGGIGEELRKGETDTLIGTVKFDAAGDNVKFTQRMGQHQNGKIVLVWPPEAANGKPVFPNLPW